MPDFDAFARYYDADYGSFSDDVPFYREMARRASGRVLEVMCGTGRVLVPLVEAGIPVDGVDISPALLARANERLKATGADDRMELYEGDITRSTPPGSYAMAFVALNSFMHLTETAQQVSALERMRAALQPDGLLILDLFNPDPRELLRHTSQMVYDKMFQLADGTIVQKYVVQSVDFGRQLNDVIFIYDELDAQHQVRRSILPFQMRWLYQYEIEHLLARTGFTLDTIYGSYDLDAYESSSELMLVVARRTAD